MLHLNGTGSPWRDLPPELGYRHAVDMRFRRWEARGVWQRLWKMLHAGPFAEARGCCWIRPPCGHTGTPLVRQKNGSEQALGRSRGGFSTKIHAATLDENSRPSASLPLSPPPPRRSPST